MLKPCKCWQLVSYPLRITERLQQSIESAGQKQHAMLFPTEILNLANLRTGTIGQQPQSFTKLGTWNGMNWELLHDLNWLFCLSTKKTIHKYKLLPHSKFSQWQCPEGRDSASKDVPRQIGWPSSRYLSASGVLGAHFAIQHQTISRGGSSTSDINRSKSTSGRVGDQNRQLKEWVSTSDPSCWMANFLLWSLYQLSWGCKKSA